MSEELEYCCLCDRVTGRAGIGDDSMSIYNKSYCESCYPDGLLEYITELEQQLTEAKKNINSLCNILESTLRAIDASGFSSDVFTDWLIEQGVDGLQNKAD
jgi:hypothetical protein